ncbi:unnamed protein product [Didymodactylos carnosus]|nr:unnamed protein product [Didymodactylos carnosus]CAF4101645.1 unnamed protein product [Didymodactylos carnosus]
MAVKWTLQTLIAAHSHCQKNKVEILQSTLCGCIQCLAQFEPGEIFDWSDDQETAMCPLCDGSNSVIGNASHYPVENVEFLQMMKDKWFDQQYQ